jgi:uncharacterized protein (TIGR03435 family)
MRTLLALVLAGTLHAQTTEAKPAFEVVSIKPLEHFLPPQGRPPNDPGRVTYRSTILWSLIMRAYDVKKYQLNTPAWMDSQYYDIEAKLPDGATQDQIPAMLQTMLADRFGLKVHWESQVQPVYALVVAKGGAKLKKSDLTVMGPDGKPVGRSMSFSTTGHFEFHRTTMDQFAQAMSQNVGRPVLNLTEIEGQYEIVIDLIPAEVEILKNFSPDVATSENQNSGSVFTMLQGLGLKLESRKAPIQHLIVDSALKVPTEN